MTYKHLRELLRTKAVFCILDDFSEIALRFTVGEKSYSVEIKHKGGPSTEIAPNEKIVLDTIMGGDVLDNEKYDQY